LNAISAFNGLRPLPQGRLIVEMTLFSAGRPFMGLTRAALSLAGAAG
jgi:hypothetical protein